VSTVFLLVFTSSGTDEVSFKLSSDGNFEAVSFSPNIPSANESEVEIPDKAHHPVAFRGHSSGSPTEGISAPSADDMILVLPASEGLPFHVKLPFNDSFKVRKVLPQLLTDVFAHVTPEWRFSWNIVRDDNGWAAVGLAFPPKMIKAPPLPGQSWRLVVPDALLGMVPESHEPEVFDHDRKPNEPIDARNDSQPRRTEDGISPTDGVDTRNAPGWRAFSGISAVTDIWVDFEAPFSKGRALFSRAGRLRKCTLQGRGLPSETYLNDSMPVRKINLLESGEIVYRRLENLIRDPEYFDLSGWRETRSRKIATSTVMAAGTCLFVIMLLYHVFLGIECSRLNAEKRAILNSTKTAFEKVFPGQKAVEPLAQTKNLLKDLEKKAESSVRLPIIDWVGWIEETFRMVSGKAVLEGIKIGIGGWKVRGTVNSYRELEELTIALSKSGMNSGVRVADSQPLNSADAKREKLRFEIEGLWK